ncbi:MAG: phage portal protein [Proteobacteria bacterium]|nr:phage portal protein [Pseudomonadota bacterium]
MIQKLKNLFSKRNMAMSSIWETQNQQPIYSTYSIQKATKDGFKSNATVYRVVYLIAKAVASVPWMVTNDEGEETGSYLTDLFKYPNPYVTRQDLFELLTSWQQLTGNAYMKKVKAGGRTAELWPISPDRIHPIPSKNVEEWILGYALDASTKVEFLPEEIVHLLLFNPSSPIIGIAPLEAIGKTIDLDNDQNDWNKSAMQNQGILSGVFSFKQAFNSQDQTEAIAEKLNEKYSGPSNARRIGVVGGEASYIRTSMTPDEMDYINSRKFNQNLICMAFGVPPQYLGSQESSTYNNYQTSEMIFWVQTIIPLLDDIADALNHSFKDELKPDEKLSYDISQVPAMRQALFDRAKTAKTLFEMGVPFASLNSVFGFGIDEFADWDLSHVSSGSAGAVPDAPAVRSEKKKGSLHSLRRATPNLTGL